METILVLSLCFSIFTLFIFTKKIPANTRSFLCPFTIRHLLEITLHCCLEHDDINHSFCGPGVRRCIWSVIYQNWQCFSLRFFDCNVKQYQILLSLYCCSCWTNSFGENSACTSKYNRRMSNHNLCGRGSFSFFLLARSFAVVPFCLQCDASNAMIEEPLHWRVLKEYFCILCLCKIQPSW